MHSNPAVTQSSRDNAARTLSKESSKAAHQQGEGAGDEGARLALEVRWQPRIFLLVILGYGSHAITHCFEMSNWFLESFLFMQSLQHNCLKTRVGIVVKIPFQPRGGIERPSKSIFPREGPTSVCREFAIGRSINVFGLFQDVSIHFFEVRAVPQFNSFF